MTGESTEAQLISSLKHYKPRHNYIQNALYHLFVITRNYEQTRCDILELIIELMNLHNKSQSVQLAATTCICNLTRENLYTAIPKAFLTQIVNSVVTTMQNFPNSILVKESQKLLHKRSYEKTLYLIVSAIFLK